jgi:hypothetical protein
MAVPINDRANAALRLSSVSGCKMPFQKADLTSGMPSGTEARPLARRRHPILIVPKIRPILLDRRPTAVLRLVSARRGSPTGLIGIISHHDGRFVPPFAIVLPDEAAALEVWTGAHVRLARHLDKYGWLTGVSLGQACAAIRAEARAHGFETTTIRVREAGKALSRDTRRSRMVAAIILVALLALVLWLAA